MDDKKTEEDQKQDPKSNSNLKKEQTSTGVPDNTMSGGVQSTPLEYQFGLPSNEQIGHLGESSNTAFSTFSNSAFESSTNTVLNTPTTQETSPSNWTPSPTGQETSPATWTPSSTVQETPPANWTTSSSVQESPPSNWTPSYTLQSPVNESTAIPPSTSDADVLNSYNSTATTKPKTREWKPDSAPAQKLTETQGPELAPGNQTSASSITFDDTMKDESGFSDDVESKVSDDENSKFTDEIDSKARNRPNVPQSAPSQFLKTTDHSDQSFLNAYTAYKDSSAQPNPYANYGAGARPTAPFAALRGIVVLIFFAVFFWKFVAPFNRPAKTSTHKTPEQVEFYEAKDDANWPEAKAKMQSAIAAAVAQKLPSAYLVDEYQKFGHACYLHGEYQNAVDSLSKALALPGISDKWIVFCTLERGNNEQHLHRQNPSYIPDRAAVEKGLVLAIKTGDKFREAGLTSLLAQLDYNDGNTTDGDTKFARADEIYGGLTGQFETLRARREVIEHWWDSRMHRTIGLKLPKAKPFTSTVTPTRGEYDLGPKVEALMKAEKFNELTKLFEQEETHRHQSYNGTEAINDLYDDVNELSGTAPESDWMARKAFIQKWIKAEPNSPIPHLVLADFMVNYAWKARQDQTDHIDWIAYQKRLMETQVELDKALDTKVLPPEWFNIAQVDFLGSVIGKSFRKDYDKIVAVGNTAYPDYMPIYLTKSYHLQPKWHGRKGEWVTYLDSETKKRTGDEADKFYYRLVNYNSGQYDDIYKRFPKLSKATVDRGQELLNKEYKVQ